MSCLTHTLLFCLATPGLMSSIAAQTWSESGKFYAEDASAGAVFGHAVSASGSTAIIGAYRDRGRGAAYIFDRKEGGWMQTAKLTARDGADDDYFGWSAAIDGAVAVVGAYGDDDAGSQSGSAYVFENSDGLWAQTAKLTDSGAQVIDGFGISAAVVGDTIFVGAPFDDEPALDCGSVSVFQRSDGGWIQTGKITAADAGEQDRFGIALASDGTWLVVGAYFDDERGTDAGAAYVFRNDQGHWVQEAKLTADDAAARDEFGYAVAMHSDTLLVGARYHDERGGDSGAVYVFQYRDGAWVQIQQLAPDDGEVSERFGQAVSLMGDVALIGADRDDDRGLSSGSAYVFRWDGSLWTQAAKLIGHDTAVGDEFGHALALTAGTALVGARQDDDWGPDSGSVFVFQTDVQCTGRERVRRAECTARNGRNMLTVALAAGTPGDMFTMELSSGERHSGSLDERGKAKVRFRGLPSGEGAVAVEWGCGATAGADYVCP